MPTLPIYQIDFIFSGTPLRTYKNLTSMISTIAECCEAELYKIIPELNQHVEVITFNQLIRAVETRHAPFFDKLFIK